MKIRRMTHIFIILLVICFVMSAVITNKSFAAKTRQLNLEQGRTYTIKHKKCYKYTSSKPGIASVTKKGKIKAIRRGRCIIKLLKNKKCIAKYVITVIKKKTKSENDKNVNSDDVITDSSSVTPDYNKLSENKEVNNTQTQMTGNPNSIQISPTKKPLPGQYGRNFVCHTGVTTLEKIESLNDSLFYLYFNIDEWYNGRGYPSRYKYVKICVDKINDEGSYKDIEYTIGTKYYIYLLGNYTEEKEGMLFSKKCGYITIKDKTPVPTPVPTKTPVDVKIYTKSTSSSDTKYCLAETFEDMGLWFASWEAANGEFKDTAAYYKELGYFNVPYNSSKDDEYHKIEICSENLSLTFYSEYKNSIITFEPMSMDEISTYYRVGITGFLMNKYGVENGKEENIYQKTEENLLGTPIGTRVWKQGTYSVNNEDTECLNVKEKYNSGKEVQKKIFVFDRNVVTVQNEYEQESEYDSVLMDYSIIDFCRIKKNDQNIDNRTPAPTMAPEPVN